jgi:hypothetical protein
MSLVNAYWNPPMIKAGESSQFILEGPAGTGKIAGQNAPATSVSVPSVTTVTFPAAGRFQWIYSDEYPGTHQTTGGSSAFAMIIVS